MNKDILSRVPRMAYGYAQQSNTRSQLHKNWQAMKSELREYLDTEYPHLKPPDRATVMHWAMDVAQQAFTYRLDKLMAPRKVKTPGTSSDNKERDTIILACSNDGIKVADIARLFELSATRIRDIVYVQDRKCRMYMQHGAP